MNAAQKAVSMFLLMGAMMLLVQEISAAAVITENAVGSEDGYGCELWKDTGTAGIRLPAFDSKKLKGGRYYENKNA